MTILIALIAISTVPQAAGTCLGAANIRDELEAAARYGEANVIARYRMMRTERICDGISLDVEVFDELGGLAAIEPPDPVSPPSALLPFWRRTGWYPDELRFFELGGSAEVRVTIDGYGNVVECKRIVQSGYYRSAAIACETISAFGHFAPATDAESRPTMGAVVERVEWPDPPPFDRRSDPAVAEPLDDPGQWVRPGDYPLESLRSSEQGVLQFGLVVGTEGRVIECIVMASSGHARLDETGCRLIKARARFNPARDEDGRATISRYRSSVRWTIPD